MASSVKNRENPNFVFPDYIIYPVKFEAMDRLSTNIGGTNSVVQAIVSKRLYCTIDLV